VAVVDPSAPDQNKAPPLRERRFPQWQHEYLTLLAERDLPVWGLPAKPSTGDDLLAQHPGEVTSPPLR